MFYALCPIIIGMTACFQNVIKTDDVTVDVDGGGTDAPTTATVTADKAHVLFAKTASGSYQRLTAQANDDGSYSFDLTVVSGGYSLVTAVKGDADGNAAVNVLDILAVVGRVQSKPVMSTLADYVCDVNGDGSYNIFDILAVIPAAQGNQIAW